MIVTLTVNPSLDRTLHVGRLERGAVLRTGEPLMEPGGKGVNVSRALVANGIPSVAVLPVAGGEGAEMSRLLDLEGVTARFVPVSGRTRSNITVTEADGSVTKLNEPGQSLADADLAVLGEVLGAATAPGDWVVVSGSMPPGLTSPRLHGLLAAATSRGAHLAIDSSGDALVASLAARPRLIKPNRAELSELTGRELGSIADVVSAAEAVRERGVELVLVSLGADGAVLVGPSGTLVGESRIDRQRSAVGAGDCFLAGFLSRFSVDETDAGAALVEALAWGAAAASLPGTAVPSPDDIDHENVRLVWRPDLDRPIVAT